MSEPSRYAYFVVNDTDDLEEMQNTLAPYGGIATMDGTLIDYSLDRRRITDLLKECKEGDTIYTPYLARLGKSLKELYRIVALANEKRVSLIFCNKPHFSFDECCLAGQVNMASLKWAVELDFEIRSEYNKAHVAKRKDAIIRQKRDNPEQPYGYVGSPKFDDMSEAQQNALLAAQEASRIAKQNRAIEWKQQSKAYARAMRKKAEGWTLTQTAADLAELYAESPEDYCTPKGRCPSKGTISLWWSQANNQTLVV